MRKWFVIYNTRPPTGFNPLMVWVGSLGWGLTTFLVIVSLAKFQYKPLQGIAATPAFLLYPEQEDFWLYIIALSVVPLVTIVVYAVGRSIAELFAVIGSDADQLALFNASFLLGWVVPGGYLHNPQLDWGLLATSVLGWGMINGTLWLQRFIIPLSWLWIGATLGLFISIALLTTPLIKTPIILQHPLAISMSLVVMSWLFYVLIFCKRSKWPLVMRSATLGILPLFLLPAHSMFWHAVYQQGIEVRRFGSVIAVAIFDGTLVALGTGLIFFQSKIKGLAYKEVLRRYFFYLAIPLLLYVLAYSPNIHRPLDLFHEGERLSTGYAIAAGRSPYRDVVFIHGFLRDPGVALLSFKLFGQSVAGLRILEHFLYPMVVVLAYYLALLCLSPEEAVLFSLISLTGFWPFFYDWRMIPCLVELILLIIFIRKRIWIMPAAAALSAFITLATSLDMGILGITTGIVFFAVFSTVTKKPRFLVSYLLPLAFCLFVTFIVMIPSGSLLACLQWNLHLLRVNAHWNGMPFPYPLDTWANFIKAFFSPGTSILALIYLSSKGLQKKWDEQCWIILVLLIANMIMYNRTIVGGQLYSSHLRDGSHFGPLLLLTMLPRNKQFKAFLIIALVGMLLTPTSLNTGRTFLGIIGKLPEKNRISIADTWVLSKQQRIGPIYLPIEQETHLSKLVNFLSQSDSFWDFTDHGLLYFLVGRLSPTRFYATHHIITGADQREVIKALEENQPAYVLYRSGTGWDAIAGIDRTIRSYLVSEYLLKNYHFYTQVGDFVLLQQGAPESFPQPLTFRVDLGYIPVIWAEDSSTCREELTEIPLDNWQVNEDMQMEATDDGWRMITKGPNGWLVTSGLTVIPRSVKCLRIRMQVQVESLTSDVKAQIFWRSNNEGFGEERSLLFRVIPDGKEHSYVIPLSPFPSWAWSDNITSIRFDPVNVSYVKIALKEVSLIFQHP